jgi:ABC-type transporter Mla MlaB component
VPEKRVVAFAIRGPIRRGGLAAVCDSADALLRSSEAGILECDVSAIGADGVAVDTLARLRLVTQRRQVRLRLRGVSPELRELIVLCGLGGALGISAER